MRLGRDHGVLLGRGCLGSGAGMQGRPRGLGGSPDLPDVGQRGGNEAGRWEQRPVGKARSSFIPGELRYGLQFGLSQSFWHRMVNKH